MFECDDIRIVNLTPHEVVVFAGEPLVQMDGNGKWDVSNVIRIPSDGIVRLSEDKVKVGEICGVPIYRKSFGSGNLPEPKEDTYYIVSLPVAQAYPERQDLLVPDELVRDENGRVVGCKAFARVSKKIRRQSKYADKLAKLDADLKEFWEKNGKVCVRVNLNKYLDMSSSYQRRLVRDFLKEKGYKFELLPKYWARVCPEGGD